MMTRISLGRIIFLQAQEPNAPLFSSWHQTVGKAGHPLPRQLGPTVYKKAPAPHPASRGFFLLPWGINGSAFN